tara:strand:- start:74 stop:475 length:402 start_codon:yes stop_codon:yes gene_type:complete
VTDCLFCKIQKQEYKDEIITENKYFYATRDTYPVTKLHTLIISKRHFSSYFDMSIDEQISAFQILKHQQNQILSLDPKVTGFNIGSNDGAEAGQSIFHLHIHLIPRRVGDIENPRGGVRGVIPAKQKYVKKGG